MKWPSQLIIIRHGQSVYNVLRDKKKLDPEYRKFVRAFDKDYTSEDTRFLAQIMRKKYESGVSDYDTPLTFAGKKQAESLGSKILAYAGYSPDVVFVSPYLRTRQTYQHMRFTMGIDRTNWPVVYDDRIREQEHGLSLLYSDWRIFQTIHSEQKLLRDLQGPYWYQFPQGESVSMVRDRIRSFMTMLVREYAGARVWVVSHHLTKLSIRANLERLSPEQFIYKDDYEKPINCGVTQYEGDPKKGKDGKLVLVDYNLKLWEV